MANHKKTLNILWNATSVRSKAELYRFLSDHNVHIVIITETWLILKTLSKCQTSAYIGLQSSANKPKGGVLIAVHKNISVEDISQQTITIIEIKTIKIKTFATLIKGAA